MKQARTWIVFIGADSEAAIELEAVLESAGFTSSWFSNVDYFLAADYQAHPRCVILDIDPECLRHGMASIERLMQAPWRWPTIVLNARGDLPVILKAMRISHFEFLQQNYDIEALLDAVHHIKRLKPYQKKSNSECNPTKLAQNFIKLSPREIEIAGEMIYGHSTKCISSKYEISEKTVELHRTRVLQKMNVRSTGELVRMYLM